MRPGIIGGANWGGGAFDPETGMLYVKTTNSANIARLVQPAKSPSRMPSTRWAADRRDFPRWHTAAEPPMDTSAPSLDTGEIAWQVPFGDDARLRAHPL